MPGAGSADISDLKMTDTTPGLTEKAAEYLPPRNLIGGLHVYNTSQWTFVGMVDGYGPEAMKLSILTELILVRSA
jgi:hypothetical protein